MLPEASLRIYPASEITQISSNTYLGLFLITQATLMFELLLTRIFSVTLWYHFAFMIISIALFGLTAGGILVFLKPEFFTREKTREHLSLFSLCFAIAILGAFLVDLILPGFVQSIFHLVSLTYLVTAIPFFFSGVAVTLALTRYPNEVGKLYAVDLAGAASGCLLLIAFLAATDGPTTVFIVAFDAAAGAFLFAREARVSRLIRTTALVTAVLAPLIVAQFISARNGSGIVRLRWVKGIQEAAPLYERWNTFSRVRVVPDPGPGRIFGWGFSPTFVPKQQVPELKLDIDAGAATVLTFFQGDLEPVSYLQYDITNIAHYLCTGAKVAAIGVGGGRDVLSALLFKQKSILAMEINPDILKALNEEFGEFTGHLHKYPNVRFAATEARSYLARADEKFDIIQASLIDTYAATAAGAFVLSENALYTVEAWKLFLERLEPGGILTFSRWYSPVPGEVYRMISLASAALIEHGVREPRKHIAVLVGGQSQFVPIGNVLVSNLPLTHHQLDVLENVSKKLRFKIILSPRFALNEDLAALANGQPYQVMSRIGLDLSPPTDDRPFFYYMVPLWQIFTRGSPGGEVEAVFTLGTLLILVFLLTTLCIGNPLMLRRAQWNRAGSLVIFFAAIGFGFMFVEISQLQRLIIFLGAPTYSLSVVLFSLLLAAGTGSYWSQRTKIPDSIRLGALITVLFIFGTGTPYLLRAFAVSATPVRILVAICTLFPIGFFMGIMFPLGMRAAAARFASVQPLLWAVNGATSVCASVLAVVISLSYRISATFWVGFGFYLLAVVLLARSKRFEDSEALPAHHQ